MSWFASQRPSNANSSDQKEENKTVEEARNVVLNT